MFRYQIKVEYDGTNFVGWQYQNNGLSIQGVLQRAILKCMKEKVKVVGSGRTDAGVHATEQSAHVELQKKIINKKVFLSSVNFFLNKYLVSILDIQKRKITFHARHSAKKRIYKYVISNRLSSLSLYKNRAWHIRKKLNIKLMKKASKLLEGTHNFSTFRASSCSAKSPIKKLNGVLIKKSKDKIVITFISRSFLQQQVRSMVGCLKYVGEEKWNLKEFKQVFNSRERSKCAPPAPPCGLYLYKVNY